MCGDEIKVYLNIKDGKIEDFSFEARGCMLCIAAASVLSQEIKDIDIKNLKKIQKQDMEKLLTVNVSKARESCVTLVLDAIDKALT